MQYLKKYKKERNLGFLLTCLYLLIAGIAFGIYFGIEIYSPLSAFLCAVMTTIFLILGLVTYFRSVSSKYYVKDKLTIYLGLREKVIMYDDEVLLEEKTNYFLVLELIKFFKKSKEFTYENQEHGLKIKVKAFHNLEVGEVDEKE